MTEQIKIISYSQLLQKLEESNQECHLLLGNGFNNSLGVNTSYKDIFEGMKQNYRGYAALEDYLKQNSYDIEKLIQKLKGAVIRTENINESFLPDFIESKVKFDFMKAAYNIVKNEIKNIYHNEKNNGIYLLFKNFTNYFSLNYDPLLYLILMKFKKADGDAHAIGLQQTSLFKQEDLDGRNNDIYTEIQKARREGTIAIEVGDSSSTNQELKNTTKTDFQVFIKNHFKDKGWKAKDIENVCDHIWEEEAGEEKLPIVNDGFLFEDYKPGNAQIQNIFFLHGAFHIYQDRQIIRKITQSQDRALYQRLEEIINAEEKNIVCVLTGTSKEKKIAIQNNEYLKNSFEKMEGLSGSLVIFGSSLDENDNHIFSQINKSSIKNLYISSNPDRAELDLDKARTAFPEKTLQLFNYESVSYKSEVSPFLKSFKFGDAIPRGYCLRSTKNWHGI